MPVIVAASSVALAVQGAIDLIAHSTTFQQRVGATNADEAKEKIFVSEYVGSVFEFGAHAVVTIADADWMQFAGGAANHLLPKNAVVVQLFDKARHADIAGGEDHNASAIDFHNFWGAVCDEMHANFAVDNGVQNFYPFNQIEFIFCGRQGIDERPNEDFWEAEFLLRSDSMQGVR